MLMAHSVRLFLAVAWLVGASNADARRDDAAACPDEGDPYDLRTRFVLTQREHFTAALSEIRAGRKHGHWSWFVWPTPPHVVDGVELGSAMNRRHALRDGADDTDGVAAARAFLTFPRTTEGVGLRDNYLAMTTAIAERLEQPGASARALVGAADEPKLRSSLRLFARVSHGGFDGDVHEACRRALRALGDDTGDE